MDLSSLNDSNIQLNEDSNNQTNEDNNTQLCNICSLTLVDNKVKLKCNHEYHYECILLWYKKTITNNYTQSITKPRECPYCRKTGGYLPINYDKKYIKFIHSPKYSKMSDEELKKLLQPRKQCKSLTSKKVQCKKNALYDKEYCHIHNK